MLTMIASALVKNKMEKRNAEKAYKKAQQPKESFSMGKAVLILGVVGGAIAAGVYLYKKAQSDGESAKLAASLETQQATMINSILKNSLLSFIYIPQADADRLIALAKQIKNWPVVQSSYSTLFGDNLAEYLSAKLTPINWQAFLNNLAVKGQPQNSSGSTIVTPSIPTAAGLVVNDSVFLNWTGKASINVYTSSTEYPQKPIVLNKPASISTAAWGKIIRIDNVKYVGSTVAMPLAQIQLAAGNKLWVRVVDLSKVRVLGMAIHYNKPASSNFLSKAI
jgi:hypothetical protein